MSEQSQARRESHVDIPNECAYYLLPSQWYLNHRYFMWAFLSPPPVLVVKLVFQHYAYRSFFCIAHEKVWGFLTLAQAPLYLKAAECIWHSAFRFSVVSLCTSVFCPHICAHWLKLSRFTYTYSYAWSLYFNLSFWWSFVLFYSVCTICIIVQSVTSYLEVHLLYTDK